MRISDALDMRGRLTIHRHDVAGQHIDTTTTNNAIVYSGRDLVAKLFANQKIDPIRYIAIGTGEKSVDPDKDKTLSKEVFRKELKALDLTKDLTSVKVTIPKEITEEKSESNRSRIILSADLDFEEPNPADNGGKPYELREAGLFNAKKNGVMYNRVVFPSISKTKDFKLTLVWEIIF